MSGRAGETIYHDLIGGAQLTIFYSGEVNIYEDVPADKAHAIMLLLSNGNNSRISGCYDRPSSKPAHVNTETTSTNTFNSIGSGVRSTSSKPPSPSAQTITQVQKKQQAQQLVIRRSQAHELPFARKASLARFLEKRKDRVDIVKLVTLKESSMVKVNEGSPACKKMKLC